MSRLTAASRTRHCLGTSRAIPQATGSAIVLAFFMALLHFGTPSLAASERQTMTIFDIVTALKQAERSTDNSDGIAREKRIRQIYETSPLPKLDEQERNRLSADDARLAFEAANIATLHTLDQAFAHDQVDAFDDLERKGIATDLQAKDTFKSLIAVRDFAGADTFSKSHPNAALPPRPAFVPARRDGATPGSSELVVSDHGRTLIQHNTAIGKRTGILVISHPLCHLTQNAVRDIEADPALRKLFTAHSKWLAPQGRDLDFSIFSNWNAQHPTLPMTVAYQKSEWPTVTDWDTPVFYFIRDGQVVSTVAGWPQEGRKEALQKAAKQVGLGAPLRPD